MKKNKLTWVTPDYFIDCDFNPDILSEILKTYDIYWIILLPGHGARFFESDFIELKKLEGLKIEFVYSSLRQRDPRRLSYYYKLYRKITSSKSDVTYINCVPDPYFVPFFWLFNKRKTIFAAHDGGVHAGFNFKLITEMSFKFSYKFVKYVCMFSSSQARLFNQNFPQAKIFRINLALKPFGKPSLERPDNKVTFLSFGVINYSKNIDLLIQAACNIYEKGYKNFKVSINGQCYDWEFYQAFIRYPELFDCKIGIVKNGDIPNLFNTSHYFVQPYRHVSQSGAMKVAFYYNLPVIATNFPGFSDEIKEGINGFLFQSGDVSGLESLMMNILDKHDQEYGSLLERMKSHIHDNYSPKVLADNYLQMFNEVKENR